MATSFHCGRELSRYPVIDLLAFVQSLEIVKSIEVPSSGRDLGIISIAK
jgi:hypothetical protein